MQFCSKCGSVLNLLEFPDETLCYSCRKVADAKRPAPVVSAPASATAGIEELQGTTFSVEGNQLVLHSAEGWILWNGSLEKPVKFDEIIKRASRILEIRRKRQGQRKN